MKLFEQQLDAALRVLDENPLGFMKSRRAGAGIPGAKPAAMPTAKPTTGAKPATDPQSFTQAPYFVEPHELQALMRDPDNQDAFNSISNRRGRHTAIAVRNAIKGQAGPETSPRTYEDNGWGSWG